MDGESESGTFGEGWLPLERVQILVSRKGCVCFPIYLHHLGRQDRHHSVGYSLYFVATSSGLFLTFLFFMTSSRLEPNTWGKCRIILAYYSCFVVFSLRVVLSLPPTPYLSLCHVFRRKGPWKKKGEATRAAPPSPHVSWRAAGEYSVLSAVIRSMAS